MDLELYTSDDKFVMKLDSDEALLGSYPIDDGCRIHRSSNRGKTMAGKNPSCVQVLSWCKRVALPCSQ
uniref:Tubulin folding cofactor B n=1 Tax=Chelonoidis abingdonii TaxID=106734 RepID=A0A8C0GKK2_CHEAB